MKFALLIYEDAGLESPKGAEMDALLAGHRHMQNTTKDAGVFVAADQLEPPPTAQCLRVRGGKTLVTDGPFAETKEHLIGFYLVDCETADDAANYARLIPHAERGCIEIRPVAYHEHV
ncbi:MAG: YciI family protein [Alphaproteobacteria bacterium]